MTYYTHNDFDDWGITDEWDNEAGYIKKDNFFNNFLNGALNLSGSYYGALSTYELQKLKAERDRVNFEQRVPKYNSSNYLNNDNLIYIGIGIVAIVGIGLLARG